MWIGILYDNFMITATTTVKLLCKPSTYCFDACEKKGLDYDEYIAGLKKAGQWRVEVY